MARFTFSRCRHRTCASEPADNGSHAGRALGGRYHLRSEWRSISQSSERQTMSADDRVADGNPTASGQRRRRRRGGGGSRIIHAEPVRTQRPICRGCRRRADAGLSQRALSRSVRGAASRAVSARRPDWTAVVARLGLSTVSSQQHHNRPPLPPPH